MMANVASQVMTTVNASYGANLTAHQLAMMIADSKSASDFDASVFAFFSEVSPALQKQFMVEMKVDAKKVSAVASQLAESSGYEFALAA